MTCSKFKQDIICNATDGTFIAPSSEGERSILFRIGYPDTGLLDNFILLFRGSKSNKQADYHSETNWKQFINWCETIFFPKLLQPRKKFVVLLDRATYHIVLHEEDELPITSWNSARLFQAIRIWGRHQITGRVLVLPENPSINC